MKLETIHLKGEFLFELKSKDEWIRKVPRILPEKNHKDELWLWIDKNGFIFRSGYDFQIGDEIDTFPCKVYRTFNVSLEPLIMKGG